MFVGDSISSLARHAFHYSAFARGEYALWDPLLRHGEPNAIPQIVGGLANPLQNLITYACVLLGMKDIALAYAICVYSQILLYAVGTFMLIRLWTEDSHAAAFAGILAAASSTVFFYTYHVTFVMLLHTTPWIIYSLSAYFQESHPRHLVMLALATGLAVYSYEVVMGMAFLTFLLIAALLSRTVAARTLGKRLISIPARHWLLLSGLLFVFLLPALILYVQYAHTTISSSRFKLDGLSDAYVLSYHPAFERLISREWLTKAFWFSLFTGVMGAPPNEQILRQCVGPLTLPFGLVALWSRDRRALCLGLAGLMICLLSADFAPLNVIFRLPLFGLIRNGHFLLQFLLFSILAASGIGFHKILRKQTQAGGFICVASASWLLCMSLYFLLSLRTARYSSAHNSIALALATVSMISVILTFHSRVREHQKTLLLTVAAAYAVFWLLLIDHNPLLRGLPNSDPDIAGLRHRTSYGLQYLSERPTDIQKINTAHLKEAQTDYGADEYSSFVTLRDNSFKTARNDFGLSSYPILMQTLRFSLLPEAAALAGRKFVFLRKGFVSSREADMGVFMREPKLLGAAVERGVGLLDEAGGSQPFDEKSFRAALAAAKKVVPPAVAVKEYRANSAAFSVTLPEAGILVYTDSWDPDWRAWLDGKPVRVLKAFHTFKAVEMTAGTHELRFEYHSRAWWPILLMHIVFALALLWLLFDSVRPRKVGGSPSA